MSITLDELWIQIDRRLSECAPDQRDDWRKVLIRRLKHPEAGANPQVSPDVHPQQGGWGAPHYDSPMCVCGAMRRLHDEEGLCDMTACNGYMPVAS